MQSCAFFAEQYLNAFDFSHFFIGVSNIIAN